MIAIKGMKIPENCSDCDFCHGHICKRTEMDIIANPKNQCPLVEIVTCKDCKSNKNNTCMKSSGFGFGVADDYFCASGKRRE